MPTLSTYEKAGIPSAFIIFPDQQECWKEAAKLNGLSGARYVCESRTIPGHIDVERVIPELMDALTRPLTPEEQKRGRWEEPDSRILFEGTIEEAQDFYQQAEIQRGPLTAEEVKAEVAILALNLVGTPPCA